MTEMNRAAAQDQLRLTIQLLQQHYQLEASEVWELIHELEGKHSPKEEQEQDEIDSFRDLLLHYHEHGTHGTFKKIDEWLRPHLQVVVHRLATTKNHETHLWSRIENELPGILAQCPVDVYPAFGEVKEATDTELIRFLQERIGRRLETKPSTPVPKPPSISELVAAFQKEEKPESFRQLEHELWPHLLNLVVLPAIGTKERAQAEDILSAYLPEIIKTCPTTVDRRYGGLTRNQPYTDEHLIRYIRQRAEEKLTAWMELHGYVLDKEKQLTLPRNNHDMQ